MNLTNYMIMTYFRFQVHPELSVWDHKFHFSESLITKNRCQEWVFLIYIILLTGQQDFCSCHIKYIIYSWISMKNWTYVGDQNTDDDVVRSNSERGPKETDTSAKYTWLTGETPFHRPSSFSVRITLKKTVIIPTLGALRDKDKNRNGHGHRETKKGGTDRTSQKSLRLDSMRANEDT